MPIADKRYDALVSLLGALCFFLSGIEFLIPKPMPFLRLGLANIPLLIGCTMLSFQSFMTLAAIKLIGQGIVNGTVFSYVFLFSAGSTIAAALTMYVLGNLPKKVISLAGVSMASAFAANMVQLYIGSFLVFGSGIRCILPPFILIGVITGLVLGLFCEQFMRQSVWYREICQNTYKMQIPKAQTHNIPHPVFRLCTGAVLLVAICVIYGTAAKLVLFFAALGLCLAEHQKIQWRVILFSGIAIIISRVLNPFGKEWFSFLGFPITEGAIIYGVDTALTFAALIYLSRWTLQVRIKLPGTFGKQLAQALDIFAILLSLHANISSKKLIGSIDEALLSLSVLSDTDAKRLVSKSTPI